MGVPGLQMVPWCITPWSRVSVGDALYAMNRQGFSNQLNPTANLATFWPFVLPMAATCRRLGISNGNPTAGNFDIGIYRADLTRLVSAGSTAQGSSDTIQTIDITDTDMPAGRYYLAIVASDATTAQYRVFDGNATELMALGVFQQSSALPLPSTATPAVPSQGRVPLPFAIFGRYV